MSDFCGPCFESVPSYDRKLTRLDGMSTRYTNFTVYKFSDTIDTNGQILAWMEGFDSLCDNPYDNFLFAKVISGQSCFHILGGS